MPCRICRGGRRTIQQAFHAACGKGHVHSAARLIEAGTDVNAPVDIDKTPLLIATIKRNYDLIHFDKCRT